MVKFNELKITNDGRKLIIDVSIINSHYFNNVYISEISIDTQDSYIEGSPSSKSIKVFTTEDNLKNVRIELDRGNFLPSLTSNLFFIYVKIKGTPSPDTPCNMDKEFTVGTVFYECPIYNNIMNSVKEVNISCNIPSNFINYLLQLSALKISIKTENYIQAVKYYNEFFKDCMTDIKSTCTCYG